MYTHKQQELPYRFWPVDDGIVSSHCIHLDFRETNCHNFSLRESYNIWFTLFFSWNFDLFSVYKKSLSVYCCHRYDAGNIWLSLFGTSSCCWFFGWFSALLSQCNSHFVYLLNFEVEWHFLRLDIFFQSLNFIVGPLINEYVDFYSKLLHCSLY